MVAPTPEVSYQLTTVAFTDLVERFQGGGLRLADDVLRRRKVDEEQAAAVLRGLPPPLLTVWERGAAATTLEVAWWSGAWPAREDAWWVLDGAAWCVALLRVASRDLASLERGGAVPVCVVRGAHGALRAVHEHLRRMKRAPITPLAQLPLRGRAPGGSVANLAASLSREGFGDLDEPLVARCVTAIVGADQGAPLRQQVERPVDEHLYDRVVSAMQRALVFLQGRVRVPHAALLPYGLYLAVLARFFDRHPSPHARNQMLLTRWYWRDVLASHEDRGAAMAIRRVQGHVTDDEHGSVQSLLHLRRGPRPTPEQCWGRVHANTKLLAAILAAFAPRDLISGAPIPLTAHFSQDPKRWFARIEGALFLHPPIARRAFTQALVGASPAELASHGVTVSAQDALRMGDVSAFVALREAALRERGDQLLEFLAAWDAPDRPPIAAFRVEETTGRTA